MTEPIVISESLGGSTLSRAAREGRLPQWFGRMPRSANDWSAQARQVIASVRVSWYDDLEPAIMPRGAAHARLRRSIGGAGLVVTTGQQPGLFGGPLMTLVKALSARALADALEQTLGIPVAPVFWAATDDADFDEGASISVALDGGARELRLEQRSPAGTPVARIPIGSEIKPLIGLLRAASGSAAHGSYLDAALRAYRDDMTMGDSYVALLREVLEPFGVSVLDVSHPSVARASAPILAAAAMRAEEVAAAVKQRTDDIAAAGFEPQVAEVPGLAHVFLNENGTKRRLTLREAAGLELREGQWLSSTVLVRPALERSLLPTAAYVGGPGEIAYFAQVRAVAEAIGTPPPIVVPRWSATIVEPRVQRILSELGVTVDAFADPHAVEGRLARMRMAPSTDAALRTLRGDLDATLEMLSQSNENLVPGDVIEGVRRAMGHRLDRLERRFIAGVKRREVALMRQISTARGSLYPHGTRQERKLAFVPFLARYGAPLMDQMLAAAGLHARSLVGDGPVLKTPVPPTPVTA